MVARHHRARLAVRVQLVEHVDREVRPLQRHAQIADRDVGRGAVATACDGFVAVEHRVCRMLQHGDEGSLRLQHTVRLAQQAVDVVDAGQPLDAQHEVERRTGGESQLEQFRVLELHANPGRFRRATCGGDAIE